MIPVQGCLALRSRLSLHSLLLLNSPEGSEQGRDSQTLLPGGPPASLAPWVWLACCRIPSRRGALKHLSFRLLPAFFWTTPEFFLSLTGAVSSCNQALLEQGWEGASQSVHLGVCTLGFPWLGGQDRGLEATWSPLSP